MKRPLFLLFLAPLSLTLAACCSSFTLTEEAQATISSVSQIDQAKLSLEYSCSLPDSIRGPLDQACLILEDTQNQIVELGKRYSRALTPEEKERLEVLRTEVIDRLYSDVDQLRAVAKQAEEPNPKNKTSVVFKVNDFSMIQGEVEGISLVDSKINASSPIVRSSITAEFLRVSVLRPDERPLGVVVRSISPGEAVSMLVDDMKRYADEKGYLSAKTRDKLED